MKDFIDYYFKLMGWRGLLCDLLNIDSNQHVMYKDAFREGMGPLYDDNGPLTLDYIILHLEACIPDIEPYRTRAKCQIRGFRDARKQRLSRVPHG